MKPLQILASALSGLAIAAALAAVPDIAEPAQSRASAEFPAAASTRATGSATTAQPVAASTPAPPPALSRPLDAASTPAQRAIAEAVRTSPHTAQVPDTAYSVRSIHVADDATWATAVLVPTDPDALDPAVALAQRRGQHWQVADLGTFEVGCELAPASVLRELGLDCG